ncbi:MAG: hypothetical protein CMP65_02040 [Flavobacteriales bacterium]|nr:hypothetical protein [Flavobacteriales bacterium]|tara:strand:+ start:1074 stop:1601 length:528 start_codon:yes stop_codon:yes gene_type:complete
MRLLIFSLIFISCQPSYQKKINNNPTNYIDTLLIDLNKKIIKNEEIEIDSLVIASRIPFIKHPLGIRLHINEKISSKNLNLMPLDGDLVMIEYSCEILDYVSQLSYDYNLIDTLNFQIGYSKQMRGLNYAIKLLEIGDKAKIIIPSYLGFGLSGYGKTVPPYSTLILNVKLLKIQ